MIVRNIPRVSSHSTSETVDEFFRRNHPDHYLGQQVHGLLLCLLLIHLAFVRHDYLTFYSVFYQYQIMVVENCGGY